ncbi:hypothetical protein ACL2XK_10670 [Sodalis sp. RH23]|uniref:hypothetical protein n=1 Tax=unclassified Sodalis (in: enterobacteria) TaxID=2636512 RepID=UPI0039B5FDF5
MLNNKTKCLILNLLAFIILSVIYAYIAKIIPLNSDGASILLEGKDLGQGNFFLQDWHLSTETYFFTDVIFYGIFTKIFGYHIWQWYVIPGILYAATSIAAINLIKVKAKSNIWLPFAVFAVPGGFIATIAVRPCIHIGTYVAILITYLLIDHYQRPGKKSITLKIILPFAFALILFSDRISLYLLFIPVFISFIVDVLKGEKWRNADILIFALIGYFFSKVIAKLFLLMNGFHLPGTTLPAFVEFDKIFNNIYLFVLCSLHFFDAMFFGKPIQDTSAIFNLLHFLLFLALLVGVVKVAKNIKTLSFVDCSLMVAGITLSVAFLASNMPIDLASGRYLFPVYVFMSILVGRNIVLTKRWQALFIFITIVLAINTLHGYRHQHAARTVQVEIRETLQKNGLTRGFATFWYASETAALGDIIIAPVNDNIDPYLWLTKNSWYDAGNNFVIAENNHIEQIARQKFGMPDRVIEVRDCKIMVWNHVISLK